MTTLAEILTVVREQSDAWGPTLLGAQQVQRNTAPRRWVWIPRSSTFGPPEGAGAGLLTRTLSIEVHSWALSEDEALLMADHMLTAIRFALNGARVLPTSERWVDREDTHKGVVLVTTYALKLQASRTTLPAVAGALTPLTPTTVAVTDAPITPEVGS